jgi:hypothetical protein
MNELMQELNAMPTDTLADGVETIALDLVALAERDDEVIMLIAAAVLTEAVNRLRASLMVPQLQN